MTEQIDSGFRVWGSPAWASTPGTTGLLLPSTEGPPAVADHFVNPSSKITTDDIYGAMPRYGALLIRTEPLRGTKNVSHHYVLSYEQCDGENRLLFSDLEGSQQRLYGAVQMTVRGVDPRVGSLFENTTYELDAEAMLACQDDRYDLAVGRPWRFRITPDSLEVMSPMRTLGLDRLSSSAHGPEVIEEIVAYPLPTQHVVKVLAEAESDFQAGRAPRGASSVAAPAIWCEASALNAECVDLQNQMQGLMAGQPPVYLVL